MSPTPVLPVLTPYVLPETEVWDLDDLLEKAMRRVQHLNASSTAEAANPSHLSELSPGSVSFEGTQIHSPPASFHYPESFSGNIPTSSTANGSTQVSSSYASSLPKIKFSRQFQAQTLVRPHEIEIKDCITVRFDFENVSSPFFVFRREGTAK